MSCNFFLSNVCKSNTVMKVLPKTAVDRNRVQCDASGDGDLALAPPLVSLVLVCKYNYKATQLLFVQETHF